MESLSSKKRVRFDSDEFESNSVATKRTRNDCSDLDSFMKSFEIEKLKLPEPVAGRDSVPGDCQPDLGFLFEASDDELGLPPTDLTPVESEKTEISAEISEVWALDDQISSYDSLEYAFDHARAGDSDVNACNDDEFVKLDGLFDLTDLGFGSSDLSLPPETMPAQ